MNPVEELLIDGIKKVQNNNNNCDKHLEAAQVNEIIVSMAKQIQEKNEYSDPEMAKFIGCTRTTYNLIKNGRKPAGGNFYRGILMLLCSNDIGTYFFNARQDKDTRKTKETEIDLDLNIDGSGKNDIKTGIKMFDHLLSQLAQHGRFDLVVSASGDDEHHVIEDVAICLGKSFNKSLGDKRGIIRMGDATVAMDDALAMVVVDISGRGYSVLELPFSGNDMAGFPTDLIRHFLETFAIEAKLNLYTKVINGTNDHHKAESLFKALGRALDIATRIDKKLAGELPSTKGRLEE